MHNFIHSLIILIVLQSCSLKSIVEYVEIKDENTEKVDKEDLVCPIKDSPMTIYGVHPFIEKHILKVIKSHRLTFEESIYLLSYYQLYLRPDSTSINSRTLHVFKNFKREGSTLYIPNNSNSYLTYLRDKLNARASIDEKRISKAIRELPKRIPVTKEMQNFIAERKTQFYNNTFLKKYFFRGNQVIKKDETYPFAKTWLNIKNYGDKKTTKINHLFKSKDDYSCSFDDKLYNNGPKFQRKSVKANSHIFGIFKSKNQFFLTMTSSAPQKQLKKNTYLFMSKELNTFNGAFCLNKNEEKIVFSLNNIHSEQLINNLIHDNKTLEKNVINKKRYLKLLYPQRNIIEIYGEDKLSEDLKKEDNTIYTMNIGRINIIDLSSSSVRVLKDPRGDLLKCE